MSIWTTMVPDEDEKGNREFPEPSSIWDHIDIAMVRPRAEYADGPLLGYKVHLGAGRKMIDGWENIEYPTWDAMAPDTSKRWRIPFETATVAEVAIYHTLDHFPSWAVVRALREIERVLLPGGVATLIHPHYLGQLANECLEHKTRYAIDTWRNVFSERQYDHTAEGNGGPWKLSVGLNFIYGLTERNLVLVTQLHKEDA